MQIGGTVCGRGTTTLGNGASGTDANSGLALVAVPHGKAVYMDFAAITEGTGLLVAVQSWRVVTRDTGETCEFSKLLPWEAFVVEGIVCRKLAEPCRPRYFQREHLGVIARPG